ncbi:hypothetical protein ASZ78_004960, partial [Callipepla squamata]
MVVNHSFYKGVVLLAVKEKLQHNVANSVLTECKLSIAPEVDILEYCKREWRGNTPAAKRMRK